jgi:hypothetical protein
VYSLRSVKLATLSRATLQIIYIGSSLCYEINFLCFGKYNSLSNASAIYVGNTKEQNKASAKYMIQKLKITQVLDIIQNIEIAQVIHLCNTQAQNNANTIFTSIYMYVQNLKIVVIQKLNITLSLYVHNTYVSSK